MNRLQPALRGGLSSFNATFQEQMLLRPGRGACLLTDSSAAWGFRYGEHCATGAPGTALALWAAGATRSVSLVMPQVAAALLAAHSVLSCSISCRP